MVFAHELGHFSVGKLFGVRVREFGFGFPLGPDKPPSERPLTWQIGKDKPGTVYSVNLIPFGGFVNLGENDPSDSGSLVNFPKHVRLAALLAGPAMNLMLGIILAAINFPAIGIIAVIDNAGSITPGKRIYFGNIVDIVAI